MWTTLAWVYSRRSCRRRGVGATCIDSAVGVDASDADVNCSDDTQANSTTFTVEGLLLDE